nr:diphosphomevalonate decarboxylase [Bacteroidota bacterium]
MASLESPPKNNFHPTLSGEISWRSPSNIALVKYWGKKGFQIPSNASLSFTLSKSFADTSIHYQPAKGHHAKIRFLFENRPNQLFEDKIVKFIAHIKPEMPFLSQYDLEIHSSNSFPHSAGIASSASAMSALSLGLCSIGNEISGIHETDSMFFKRVSNIARLGSGSASRSIYGGVVTWGKTDLIDDSSDSYATPLEMKINPVFHNYRDTILIVNKGEKKISSRAGHGLMNGHPYAKARYAQAGKNLEGIYDALQTGNSKKFITIVENEAMSLHAMMMSSEPGFLLMMPETLKIIDKIGRYRKQTGANICFTLDAGPNVHVLFPEDEQGKIKEFIYADLTQHCENGQMIEDKMGNGPQRIN